MTDQFGDLRKYEKSYLRSQARQEERRVRALRTRVSRVKIVPLLDNLFKKIKKTFYSPSPITQDQKETMKKISDSVKTKAQRATKVTEDFIRNYVSGVREHSERIKKYDDLSHDETENFSGIDLSNFLPMKTTKKLKKKIPTVRKNRSLLKNLFFAVGTLILLGGIFIFAWFSTLEIPDVATFDQRKISNSTKIYDRTGEVILYDIHEDIQRTVVSFDNINQYAKDAIVAIEDHNFYEHHGVVVRSTLRAITQTILSKIGLSSGGTAGGSTLTQQVVKNTLLNSKKLISRKVKEWVLAYKIEKRLSKDQILEIYLNEAPYGGTVYGIQEASRIFFGVSSSEVTLGQAAYLAAIPNLPTYYSPYGSHKAELDQRQKLVLHEMKRYGYVSDEQYRAALEEVVVFLPQEESGAKALHFVEYIRAYLEKTYGADLVENGGLKVVTTLDYELQERAEQILKDHIIEVKDAYSASNAALVAVESSTGQILTMVGSQNYFDTESEGNFNVATALRQPGSVFKPIAYANAFTKGYLPETVVFDTQTQFTANCNAHNFKSDGTCYAPNNHDGKFLGPMNLRNALAQSRNIPAIKMLYLGGVADTLKLAQNLGISSLTKDSNYYGLGLVLGGGEVSLLELTNAYAVFSNEGIYNKPVGILSVADSDENVLESYQSNESKVLSENVARMISSVLSDNVARTPLFGSQSFLYFGNTNVAGKTGTTNDNRDAWLVGYTSSVAVGVWTGNNDNTPMKKGSSISGKPWRSFMEEIIKKHPSTAFTNYSLPNNFSELPAIIRGEWKGGTGVSAFIDTRTGEQATSETPEEFQKEFGSFDPHNILYWINKDNPLVPNQSHNDSQFSNWEASVQSYTHGNYQENYESNLLIDNLEQDIDEDPNGGSIRIKGLTNDHEYQYEDSDRISVSFNDIDIDDVIRVDFSMNGNLFGSDTTQPFTIDLIFSELENLQDENTIEVRVITHSGVEYQAEESFNIIDLPILSDVPVANE